MQSTISRNKREGAFFLKTGKYYTLNAAKTYYIPYANRRVRKSMQLNARKVGCHYLIGNFVEFCWPALPAQ